jgi:biotin transport system permease protein
MAEVNLFHYIKTGSFLDRMDVRYKLGCFLILNSVILVSEFRGLVPIAILVCTGYLISKQKAFRIVRELRFFLIFMLVVLFSRALSTPGTILLSIGPFSISEQGVLSGLIFTARFFIIIFLGHLFAGTTSTSRIRQALSWLLSWTPGEFSSRAGSIAGLSLAFIPRILDDMLTVLEAQRARGLMIKRSPVRGLTSYIGSLFRKVFFRTETILDALEARCYSEQRTEPPFIGTKVDLPVLLLCCGIAVAAVVLRFAI